ncbi:helix-turn-helix domain-containing protein [Legionella sp. W05-934-2]|uniref:helix-turn-helix domain-containing protein n=1 Tax=Legionella sp. W05-934-2 TaxID=1198649 RepID=UPI0034633695
MEEERNSNDVDLSCIFLAKNLKRLLHENSINESILAKTLNIPYNTVKRLTSGITTDPRISTLQLIAQYFELSVDQLLGNLDTGNTQKVATSVPLFDWSDISNPDFFSNLNLDTWSNWYPIPPISQSSFKSKAYAIKSRPSMQPRFPLGTVLVVDPEADYFDGDIVLVRIKDQVDISVREIVIDPPTHQLLSIVKNSSTLMFDKTQHEIIGVIMLTMFQRVVL